MQALYDFISDFKSHSAKTFQEPKTKDLSFKIHQTEVQFSWPKNF
jgi:hypothetical protein